MDIGIQAAHHLQQHSAVSSVTVHAWINDLKFKQSQELKSDFIALIDNQESVI